MRTPIILTGEEHLQLFSTVNYEILAGAGSFFMRHLVVRKVVSVPGVLWLNSRKQVKTGLLVGLTLAFTIWRSWRNTLEQVERVRSKLANMSSILGSAGLIW